MNNAATWYKTVLDYWESPRIRYLPGPVELTWRKTLDAMFRWGDGGSYEIDLAQFAGIVKAANTDAALEHAQTLHHSGCGDWTALRADGAPVPWRGVADAPVSRLRIYSGFVADEMEKLNADRNRKRRTDGTPRARRSHAAGAPPPRHSKGEAPESSSRGDSEVAETHPQTQAAHGQHAAGAPPRRKSREEESREEEKNNEPAVPVVFRPPSEPQQPTAGTAGTTGSSAPPLNGNGNGRHDHCRNGDVASGRARALEVVPGVDRGVARAAAANGGGATTVLEGASDPIPGAAPIDPTSVAAILRDLAPEDLGDPKRFEPFFHRLRRAGKAPNPERQLVSHFALALECRRVGRNPVGLFIARLEDGDWSRVKPDDFAFAEIALGKRDVSAPAEKARLEEASEKKTGGRLPKDVPLELRDRLHATTPGTLDHQAACDAIVAWRREHDPGPRLVDPDAAGISVAALVDRMRGRKVE